MVPDNRLATERFPRSSKYHPEWILASVSGGANSLWLTEWLAEAMDLRAGMRVLDLARGVSSIFLHREFGVQVWATDLWFSAAERLDRIRDAGVADGVFPIHADARSLPFATGFFDAIVSIDSFVYYGTDDLYLNYLARFVQPGGSIGIAGSGLMREVSGPVPEHLQAWWEPSMCCLHCAESCAASTLPNGGAGTGCEVASWTCSLPTPCPTAGRSGSTGNEAYACRPERPVGIDGLILPLVHLGPVPDIGAGQHAPVRH